MKQHGGNMAKAAQAYREQKGGHYARADGSVLAKDRGKYGHTHKPGKNPAVTYEDAKSDEPVRAPSPPARRATRNMDPRERRRLDCASIAPSLRPRLGRGYEKSTIENDQKRNRVTELAEITNDGRN